MLVAVKCDEYMIRKAIKEEVNSIYYLVQRAFSSYGNNIFNPVTGETVEDISLDLERNIILVLEYRKKLAGSLRLVRKNDVEFYLKRFAIHPDFQNMGFGTELFYEAEKLAKEEGGRIITLHSSLEEERLVKFYSKLGFKCLQVDEDNGYRRGFWQKNIVGDGANEIMGW
ncbi:MAG: GNAT family N-acetyltransferase [Halanaerobiaceae bacterium]|nr:GNAT family N-acetyltransferase [Halanaerobiaceae bacterium]